MTVLRDNIGNEIVDITGSDSNIDAFPWGNLTWSYNKLTNTVFVGGFAVVDAARIAGLGFHNNEITGSASLDFTSCTGGGVTNNDVRAGGSLAVVSGAANAVATGNQIGAGSLTISSGGSATKCRISTGAILDTGAFAATSVVVDGAITQTLTGANTNTYAGFGLNTLI